MSTHNTWIPLCSRRFSENLRQINTYLRATFFHCSTWINGSLHCVDSQPSAVPYHWQSADCWSWWHAMVIHSEMALWQLWSSFDSSNCSPSRVKMGLSLALSYNKKHLVGMLMNKNAKAKGRLLQDKLWQAGRQPFWLSKFTAKELWNMRKTIKRHPFGSHRRCNCCVFVQ